MSSDPKSAIDSKPNDKTTSEIGSNASLKNGNSGNSKVPTPMQIFVKLPDPDFIGKKTLALMVKPSDKIWMVKEQIENRAYIPSERQRLIYGGKQFEDEFTLMDYNVQRDSTLHLLPRLDFGPFMQIFVMKHNKTKLTFLAAKSDLIQTIKEKIYKREGIPPFQQRLTFCGKLLEDGRALGDYIISHGSTVYLDSNHHEKENVLTDLIPNKTSKKNSKRH